MLGLSCCSRKYWGPPPPHVLPPTCAPTHPPEAFGVIQVRSSQVLPATTIRQHASDGKTPNTHTQNPKSRFRFRWNPDSQKGLQPVDEDYLTQRGLQLVKASR